MSPAEETAVRIERVERAVRDFCERAAAAGELMEQLDALIGLQPESPLSTAVWSVLGGWERALDEAYDLGGWLDWWWLECGLGARPKGVRLPGGEERLIATVDELVKVVLIDLRRCEARA